MKILLSHPSGNQFFRHLAAAFYRRGMLSEVATCVNWSSRQRNWFDMLLPHVVRQELARRSFDDTWATRLHSRPLLETVRLVGQRFGIKLGQAHETGWCSVDAVYQDFDRWLARQLPTWQREALDAVYAYEDGALAVFLASHSLGMRCYYDLPIAYWETGRRLMSEEAERLPAWAQTLGGGVRDSPAKLERKTRELELADMVVVPSQFVADSLPIWVQTKRVVVAPFGSPPLSIEERLPAPTARRFRVLFAGSMGQRKGLGDLFAAMRLLKRSDVELVVMGSSMAPMDFYRREFADFTYEEGRPHDQVLALMRSCDVLVLPSIVEGRALVMQEAMSQGLPIIITPNTGGEDLIEEDRTGFLVPIRSPERIAEKISWLADHRAEAVEMGRLAQCKAEACTWANYGDIVCAAVAS